MRRLTAEEVAKEVSDIETKPWPHRSVLPVKNLYDDRKGCIFRKYGEGPEWIVPEITIPKDGTTPVKFASLRAMVEAGWVAD